MNYKRLILFVGNIALIFFAAGFSKMLILDHCIGKVLTDTNAFLSLVLVTNDGAAFNLFSGFNAVLIGFAAVIILLCMCYVLFYKLFISEKFLLFMAMFCAGIFGNAYERYMYNCVTDYIKVNVLNFPVFNLYDILITLGALSIVLWLVKDKTMEIQEIKNVEEDDLYRDL